MIVFGSKQLFQNIITVLEEIVGHINTQLLQYNLVSAVLKVYAINLECREGGTKSTLSWGEERIKKSCPQTFFPLNLNNNSSNLECQSPKYSFTINTT